MSGPGPLRDAFAVGLAAFALAVVALGNGFALDDRPLVEKNPFLTSLSNAPRFFASDYFEPVKQVGLYRPLVTTSFALNRVLGSGPAGFHLANALLHAAVVTLAVLWIGRLTRDRALASAAGLLFAWHAVHAEVLGNVAFGRPELMAAFFVLVALLGFRPSEGGGEAGPRAWSVAAFAAALLCKESAVTLLLVLPLIDALYGPGLAGSRGEALGRWRSRLRVYGVYAAAAVAVAGLRWWALDSGGVLPVERAIDNPLVALPAGWRIASALDVALRYAGLLVLPWSLAYDRSYAAIAVIETWTDPRLWIAVTGWAVAACFGAALLRRSRDAAFGLLFAVLTFSVVSNVAVPIGTIYGERLLYLPSLGFCVALAVGLLACARRLAPRRAAPVAAVLVGAVALAHGARAVDRILDWRSENGLYVHDLAVSPGSVKVQTNAGAAFAEMGRHEEALACYDRAIEIDARLPAPHRGRVLALLALERFAEAQAAYRDVLRFGPAVPEVEAAIRAGLGRKQP